MFLGMTAVVFSWRGRIRMMPVLCTLGEYHRLKLRPGLLTFVAAVMIHHAARAQPASPSGSAIPVQQTLRLQDGGGNAGVMFVRPGAWGGWKLRIENPTEETVHALATGNFSGQPTLQFGTEFAMPRNTRLNIWQPVRAPDSPQVASPIGEPQSPLAAATPAPTAPQQGKVKIAAGLEVNSILITTDKSREDQLDRKAGMVRVEYDAPSMAVMNDFDSPNDVLLDFAAALKSGAGKGKRVFSVRPDEAPPLAAGWETLDNLILAANHPPLDEAQIAALRHWILAGGKLWITLDTVDPDFARRLLRDDWTVEVIDRVALYDFQIEDGVAPVEVHGLESPVDLVRVSVTDMEVTHRVGEWPAAMRKSVGRGMIYVTTLGTRGWMTDWFIARDPLVKLGTAFLQPTQKPSVTSRDFQKYLFSQIGYSIVSRTSVAVILILFIVSILIVGLVLMKRNQLEWLGAYAGAGAIVVAIIFVLIGLLNRWEVPLTVAGAQLVQVVPDQDEAIVTGELSVYSPKDGQGPIEATRGGVVWPDMAGQGSGDILRMVWTDIDKWQWRGLTLPSGAVRNTEVRHTVPLAKTARAGATFDENGIVVTLKAGPFEDLQDLVIATPTGHLAPRTVSGKIHGVQSDVLPVGQYISGSLADQTRVLRQEIYRRLLGDAQATTTLRMPQSFEAMESTTENQAFGGKRIIYPDQPMLLAWAQSMSVGIELVQKDAQLRQSALVMIPLEFVPPAPGSRVRVPSPFISLAPARRVRGETGMVYDASSGEWIPSSSGATVNVRFQLPRILMPLHTTALKATLDIQAPGRKVDLLAKLNGESVLLGSFTTPNSPIVIDVPAEQVPQPDEAGGVALTLRVDDGDESSSPWLVRSFTIEVGGTTAER